MHAVTSNNATEYNKWQELSDEWKASGENQEQFCKRKQISYSQFVYWRSKLLQTAGKSRPQLAAVKMSQPDLSSPKTSLLKLVLPNGVTMYIPPMMPQATITAVITSVLQSC